MSTKVFLRRCKLYIYKKYYYSYYTSKKRPGRKTKEDFKKPSEIYVGYRCEDLAKYGFSDVTMKFYDSEKIYTADEYIAFLDTMSDHRTLPSENKNSLYKQVKQAILCNGNSYKENMIFQLYMGRK